MSETGGLGAGADRSERRATEVALVGLGGACGTGLRMLVTGVVPDRAGVPVGILTVNLAGAFALGLVLALLERRSRDEGTRRRVRLLVGTGVLGGFTTYSALAADTASLLGDGALVAGLAYAAATVVGGLLAAWAGLAVGQQVPAAVRRDP